MDVRNCDGCRTIFQYPGFGEVLCPVCKKKDDEEFEKVKDFLSKNPGATQKMVHDETGVEIKKIMRWLREERLITKDASGLGLKCEHCGASICSGRLCTDCKRKIAVEYGLNRKPVKEQPKPLPYENKDQRMRFLNRGKK